MQSKLLSSYLLPTFGIFLGLFFALNIQAATPANIIVKVTPENPAPYENTTINLSSFSYNLDTVMITWLVDGRTASSGVGKKSFSVTAPASGSSTTVVAKMDFPDGATESRIMIRPAAMALLWQATDSFVPPFYKGKALATLEGNVKVVAMPEIKSGSGYIDGKNMAYYWKKDYTNDQGASGYGKNFFLYTNDYLDGLNNVSVVASTADGKYSSTANINIGTVSPQISFYKKDLTFGILWEDTLESGHRIEGEEIIVAVPYFLIPKQIQTPTLVFKWSINGTAVPVESYRKNVVPLKVAEGTTGTSKLRLDIESTDRIFQTASKEINVEF
jgi:hypothetical protein